MANLSISGKAIVSAILGVAVLGGVLGSAFTIDEGYRGVLLRMGKVQGVVDSGLHFKIPYIDSVEKISTRNQALLLKESAYTRDQQTAAVKLSVRYQVPHGDVGELYSKYHSIKNLEEKLISRIVTAKTKNYLGQYAAQSAVQTREELSAKILQSLQEEFNGKEPVSILSFQLEDIEYSKNYEQSVEARMKAEVEVATKRQVLEKERIDAEIVKVKAEAEAQAKFIQAEAEAKAILEKGRAEAKVLEERGEAIRKNPNVIQLMTVQRWNGVLPTQMVPNGTLPFLDLKTRSQAQ